MTTAVVGYCLLLWMLGPLAVLAVLVGGGPRVA
jgi:hypothetical protein